MIPITAQIEMFPAVTDDQAKAMLRLAEQMNKAADAAERKENPLDVQVGGGHYKDMKIQPVEFIHANNIPYFEGNVIKYVSRWRSKNGIADLEKAKHYIDLLIELETRYGADTRSEG